MRSSTTFLAALVGVASAGMPEWSLQMTGTASNVYGGGVGSTGKPHLGPGPVVFPSGRNSGGMYPSGVTGKPTGSGVGPTGTGYGGIPPPTPGPTTTTVTHTSDVTSK